MNYGKKKAAKRQKKITSKSTMQGKRIVVRLFKALLICIVLAAVVGMAGGGLFIKKIIDDTPHVSTSDVKPKGFTTFVYADDGSTEIERFNRFWSIEWYSKCVVMIGVFISLAGCCTAVKS